MFAIFTENTPKFFCKKKHYNYQNVLDESGGKPSKIRVDQDLQFYNSSMMLWVHDNNIEMYSKHNQEKSVIVERFIRTLNSQIYKHIKMVSKICKLIS